ncbi:uncharacterized protein LY79DRAFT_560800, partial [Colletotrichum navitas]
MTARVALEPLQANHFRFGGKPSSRRLVLSSLYTIMGTYEAIIVSRRRFVRKLGAPENNKRRSISRDHDIPGEQYRDTNEKEGNLQESSCDSSNIIPVAPRTSSSRTASPSRKTNFEGLTEPPDLLLHVNAQLYHGYSVRDITGPRKACLLTLGNHADGATLGAVMTWLETPMTHTEPHGTGSQNGGCGRVGFLGPCMSEVKVRNHLGTGALITCSGRPSRGL